MQFENKVVAITGGAGGIGIATAKKFASLQAKIVIIDISEKNLEAAADEIKKINNADVMTFVCDVSQEENVSKGFDAILERYGQIDVVVNNAGLMVFKPLEEQTLEDWQKIFKVDLFGAFFFTKFSFRHMKPDSCIVNVSSIHAIETEPMVAPYATAKAALLSLTRSSAIEGKPKGIRVNAVLPGAIDTPMLWDNPNVKSGVEKINKDDVGTPEDVAEAIAYLSSDEATFIQGAMLNVDGGRLDRL